MSEVPYGSVVEVLGAEAEPLIIERGGRSVYIPHHPGPHSPLVQILGQDAANRLAARHGGNIVCPPILKARRLRIIELRRQGWTITRIAADMRCTERTIYKVLAEAQAANDQLALPLSV